jgi:hypothetical protein
MRESLKNMIADYRKMYMSELLTENAERIAYLDGVIDGLELALEVVKNDNSRES